MHHPGLTAIMYVLVGSVLINESKDEIGEGFFRKRKTSVPQTSQFCWDLKEVSRPVDVGHKYSQTRKTLKSVSGVDSTYLPRIYVVVTWRTVCCTVPGRHSLNCTPNYLEILTV